jgi:DNA-binding phage protein
LHGTLDSFEVKRLSADGTEPSQELMRGLTIARPVRVEFVTPIGKEVIVDPTDTDEGLTAEMLSATAVLEYQDPNKRLEQLRAKIRQIGLSVVARESGVSRSQIKAFLNQGTTPHRSTITQLTAAVGRCAAR